MPAVNTFISEDVKTFFEDATEAMIAQGISHSDALMVKDVAANAMYKAIDTIKIATWPLGEDLNSNAFWISVAGLHLTLGIMIEQSHEQRKAMEQG